MYLLQETHVATVTDEQTWTQEWGGSCVWSRGSHRSCGVGILLNPNSEATFKSHLRDNEGRVVSAKLQHRDQEMNIINIYAPTVPRERKEFMGKIWNYKTGDTNLILGGDFNCVEDPQMDKLGGNPTAGTIGTEELRDFIDQNKLTDIWRKQHPQDRIYTWSTKDFKVRSRLDRWYIPIDRSDRAQSCIRACPLSDHSAAEIMIELAATKRRGKGVWKINNSILDDQAFQREIQHVYNFWKSRKQEYANNLDWWDEVKSHFKEVAIAHSIRKSRERHKQENQLRSKLTSLQNESKPDVNMIQSTRERLEELVTARLEGVKVRSRATWLEQGERPTKYFFKLEQTKQNKASISKLKTPTGEATTDEDILHTAAEFYRKLYTEETIDETAQEWFLNQMDSKLGNAAKDMCEGPVTRKELDTALKRMHDNKAPGPDGLSTEFYKTFWPMLADDLTEVFNLGYENEQLSESQMSSILRLLFKKGERELIENWRPISLLNTDYKLLATVIANRLRPTLPDVIHEDQTCGIPQRSIYENVMKLRDMVHEVSARGQTLTLINLDQAKAFDRVDRAFLEKILIKLNYGPSFRKWITTLYTGAKCNIINNGHLSETVYLRRGVRQGCPLSPLLYVIVIETLANAIRADKRIEGIAIPGTTETSKISAYADDATLTIKGDRSIARAFEVIERYERASGSKLNMDKTEGIYVGTQAGRTTGPVPIKWKIDAITVLGTRIGNDLSQIWERQIEKLERKCEAWKNRTVTMIGKALLIRTYGIAALTYLASLFPAPKHIITRAQRICFRFLWKEKNELVSRATCYLAPADGGLGIPDLQDISTICMAKWIKAIVQRNNEATWLHYGRYWTGFGLGTMKDEWAWLRSNLKPHGDPCNIPPWYEILLQFCQKYRKNLVQTPDHQLNSKRLRSWIPQTHTPRCEREWARYVAPPLKFDEYWYHLWHSEAENKVKEFLWRLAHRVLPTKRLLRQWGIQTTPECPFCDDNEDLHHALISCRRAKDLWNQISHLIGQITNIRVPIRLETIAFGMHLPQEEKTHRLAYYIIALTAHTLWSTRNKKIVDTSVGLPRLHQNVIEKIKNRVRAEEHINKTRVADFWGQEQIILDYTNQTLNFKI